MSRPLDWSPLRSRDPVPGDPAAVRALAQRWAETADAAASAAAGLRAVHGSATTWRSASGRAFRDRTGTTAVRVGRVQGRYAAGAQVLDSYASALQHVQDDAVDALLRARCAQDDLDVAERVRRSAVLSRTLAAAATGAAAAPDAVEQRAAERSADARRRIARADADLTRAESDWRDAGRRAVAALDEVADDGLTDRFDGPLGTLETASLWLSRVSAGTGLGALVPGVNAVAGPVALTTGAAAATATAVLWANHRATRGDVALAVVAPAANLASRSLRALDAALPDEVLASRGGAPRPGGRSAAPSRASTGPSGRTTGERPPAGNGSAPATRGASSPAGAGPSALPGGSTRTGRAARVADGVSTTSDVATITGAAPAVAESRTGR